MPVPIESVRAAAPAEILPGVWLDSRLAVWIEAIRVLAMADLHWGYAESHRVRGNLLPRWGDDEVEARLRSVCQDYSPAEMIWVGDVVHAAEGGARAERFLRSSDVPITVLAGNHDRRWRGAGVASVQRDRYFFHHGDRDLAVPDGAIEIIGHHHPAIDWHDGAGGRIRVPALVATPHRLILPAFSPWAHGSAGTWASDTAATLWAISAKRIFALPARQTGAS